MFVAGFLYEIIDVGEPYLVVTEITEIELAKACFNELPCFLAYCVKFSLRNTYRVFYMPTRKALKIKGKPYKSRFSAFFEFMKL